jgi:alcohol dehydrogenase class IV
VESVQEALDLARKAECDAIVAVGGGSAIDAAKAVAALLANGGEPLDYMEVVGKAQKITKPSVPWIAVPTTAGTGAEATRNSVVGYHQKQYKASIRSELMLPRMALLDAELAVGVPRNVTAASGSDALCQVIESYTSVNANPISDGLALEGIGRAARSLRKVYDNPADLDAREDMAIAALLSGITLANAGLGAVHGLAAPMGGRFPVPHGVVCAALLPHVIATNVAALRERQPASPALNRYAVVGRTLTGNPGLEGSAAIDAAVRFVQELAAYMQIPHLHDFGVSRDAIGAVVELAKKASSMRHNPIALTDAELTRILEAAL